MGGSTGEVLNRSLVGMGKLIDRSLSEVRIKAGLPAQHRVFSVADFIDEVKLSAGLEAQVEKIPFAVSPVDPSLLVAADRDLLSAAVGNQTGLGLGLSISKRGVELNKGTLSVRDVPGSGCIFTIDLPRHSLAAPVVERRFPE